MTSVATSSSSRASVSTIWSGGRPASRLPRKWDSDVVEGFGGRRGVGLEQDPGAFVVVESLERVGELGSVQRASEVGRAADVGRGEHGLEGEVGTFVRGRGARRRLVAGHGSSSRASLA